MASSGACYPGGGGHRNHLRAPGQEPRRHGGLVLPPELELSVVAGHPQPAARLGRRLRASLPSGPPSRPRESPFPPGPPGREGRPWLAVIPPQGEDQLVGAVAGGQGVVQVDLPVDHQLPEALVEGDEPLLGALLDDPGQPGGLALLEQLAHVRGGDQELEGGQHPPPSTHGRRRWLSTPARLSARRERTWACCSAGKKDRIRSTVCGAFTVCRVDITMCPVSVASSAAITVSASRISPIRITSGLWRRAWRRPSRKSRQSVPTSRWLITHSLLLEEQLDRVLEGDHVALHVLVQVLDHAPERGRFSGTGNAGNEDQPALAQGEVLQASPIGSSSSTISGASSLIRRMTTAGSPICL